jgi:hypothetical protein
MQRKKRAWWIMWTRETVDRQLGAVCMAGRHSRAAVMQGVERASVGGCDQMRMRIGMLATDLH